MTLLLCWLLGCTCQPPHRLPEPRVVHVTPAEAGRLVMVSVGDTDVGNQGFEVLERRGVDYAFRGIERHLAADVGLFNLETTVTAVDPDPDDFKVQRMRPEWLPELTDRGLTLASLANNHTMDQGIAGLEETLGFLDQAGIVGFGGGLTLDDARRPLILEVATDDGPLRIGLVSVWEHRESRAEQYADPSRGGLARFPDEQLFADLEALDATVDVLVVTVHWGKNYVQETDKLRKRARQLVDHGADLVNGHGAHLVQGVELVDGVPVLYSLGNFVFSSFGGYAKVKPELRLSVVARYGFDRDGVARLELLPIRTDNKRVRFQPVVSTEAQATAQLLPVIERYGLSWTRSADGWYALDR